MRRIDVIANGGNQSVHCEKLGLTLSSVVSPYRGLHGGRELFLQMVGLLVTPLRPGEIRHEPGLP
jgi:hypothetical protein